MTEKKTIVHVIDDLGRGGAETLLVDLLKDLGDYYNIVLVTLTPALDFNDSEIKCQYRYCLNYKGRLSSLAAVIKLRKIIKKHNPVLVRSQLLWGNIIARVACPRNIPLVFSIHVTVSDGIYKFKKKGILYKWIEKIIYKPRHSLVGVSREVVVDYGKTIGIRGESYVLHNYVNNAFFSNAVNYVLPQEGRLRLVAVGNPKKQKNYELLIRAFNLLKDKNVTCAIYGMSEYNPVLQQEIDKYQLPIQLKGKAGNIYEKLKCFDAYIMCSLFEGFGIAVAEAMAVGLPLFLSDIEVLREVSHDNAIFFDPEDEKELAEKIKLFIENKYDSQSMSERGKNIAKENYSKAAYLKKLLAIYDECISNANDSN
jgi:glycosyltransferase involved in cell wall biosynthesis